MENAAVIKPVLSKPSTRKPNRRKPPFLLFALILMLLILAAGIKHGVQMSRKYIEGTEGHIYLDEEGNPEVIPRIYKKHYENLRRLERTGIWLKRPPGNKIYR